MITVLIMIGVGAFIGWLLGEKGDYVMTAFTVFAMALLFSMIGLVIAVGIGASLPTEYVLDKQIELVAMNDTMSTQGRFFLGCGTISSKSYYVFYQKEGKGFKLGKLPAEKVVVFEEQRSDGLIKVYKTKFVSERSRLFGFNKSRIKYEIYVPEGTILHKFNLDLE